MNNGWNQNTHQTDHAQLQRYVKALEPTMLDFVATDARQAMLAMPEGPKAGYYADLVHYIAMRKRGIL